MCSAHVGVKELKVGALLRHVDHGDQAECDLELLILPLPSTC